MRGRRYRDSLVSVALDWGQKKPAPLRIKRQQDVEVCTGLCVWSSDWLTDGEKANQSIFSKMLTYSSNRVEQHSVFCCLFQHGSQFHSYLSSVITGRERKSCTLSCFCLLHIGIIMRWRFRWTKECSDEHVSEQLNKSHTSRWTSSISCIWFQSCYLMCVSCEHRGRCRRDVESSAHFLRSEAVVTLPQTLWRE